MLGIEAPLLWAGFTVFVLAVLALDLGLFQRRPHAISTREAMAWFATWTGLALLFAIGLMVLHPRHGGAALEFLAGFLVEKSLSIDNVFVFILIFSYFRVPPAYQHKVLFWGIVGALVLRITFIVGGLALMERFHWVIYVFGTFLLGTGIAMMFRKKAAYDPSGNAVLRIMRRLIPVTDRFEGNRFFVRRDGRRWATPLFVALVAIESSDIVFAADSIPAIFAITSDPFIVYTSNIFAMLGLRALYFAVSGFMQTFHLLHYGFASIITILGIKMLLSDVYHVPLAASLSLILVILLLCVIFSLLRPRPADLKPLLRRTEKLGLIPFRRLLLIENIIDMGDLTVRDAMRERTGVQALDLALPWDELAAQISRTRYSRYPLVEGPGQNPGLVLHVKNIVLPDPPGSLTPGRLRELARPIMVMAEDLPLEEALVRFQRRYEQMSLVVDAQGAWRGVVTIEDVLEEIVGKIGDEFDSARGGRFFSLADVLSPGRVVLNLRAESLHEAIATLVESLPRGELPVEPAAIIRAVQEREALVQTYVGHGLAIPHARLDGLDQPVLCFARSDEGVPIEHADERAYLILLLLTPTSMARLQPGLLADIVGLLDSDYVIDQLRQAPTPGAIIDAIRAGEQVTLD